MKLVNMYLLIGSFVINFNFYLYYLLKVTYITNWIHLTEPYLLFKVGNNSWYVCHEHVPNVCVRASVLYPCLQHILAVVMQLCSMAVNYFVWWYGVVVHGRGAADLMPATTSTLKVTVLICLAAEYWLLWIMYWYICLPHS